MCFHLSGRGAARGGKNNVTDSRHHAYCVISLQVAAEEEGLCAVDEDVDGELDAGILAYMPSE